MKTLKEQAEEVDKKDRQQETIDNLKKATPQMIQARKDLDKEIEKGKLAISALIKGMPVDQQGEVRVIEAKVNMLLEDLRNGGDIEEITRKLKFFE